MHAEMDEMNMDEEISQLKEEQKVQHAHPHHGCSPATSVHRRFSRQEPCVPESLPLELSCCCCFCLELKASADQH